MSWSGWVRMRRGNPGPAPVLLVHTILAHRIKSLALVVVDDPLCVGEFEPSAAATTSTWLLRSAPLYSKIRTSGYPAAPLNVTVTVFPFAAAPLMFLA